MLQILFGTKSLSSTVTACILYAEFANKNWFPLHLFTLMRRAKNNWKSTFQIKYAHLIFYYLDFFFIVYRKTICYINIIGCINWKRISIHFFENRTHISNSKNPCISANFTQLICEKMQKKRGRNRIFFFICILYSLLAVLNDDVDFSAWLGLRALLPDLFSTCLLSEIQSVY